MLFKYHISIVKSIPLTSLLSLCKAPRFVWRSKGGGLIMNVWYSIPVLFIVFSLLKIQLYRFNIKIWTCFSSYCNDIKFKSSLRIHISLMKFRFIKSILMDPSIRLKPPKRSDFENMSIFTLNTSLSMSSMCVHDVLEQSHEVLGTLLTPNILCDHDLVVSNSLWPLWH